MENGIYLVESNKCDFPGVETSSPEVEKGIYLVEGNN